MDNEVTMDYTLSPEAQKTIAELIGICMEHKTDTITMELDYPTATLEIEMNFVIHPKRSIKDGED